MWILVLYIYAGALARGDSVSVTSIPGFSSIALCEKAGQTSKPLVSGSTKEIRFVCLQSGNK